MRATATISIDSDFFCARCLEPLRYRPQDGTMINRIIIAVSPCERCIAEAVQQAQANAQSGSNENAAQR